MGKWPGRAVHPYTTMLKKLWGWIRQLFVAPADDENDEDDEDRLGGCTDPPADLELWVLFADVDLDDPRAVAARRAEYEQLWPS